MSDGNEIPKILNEKMLSHRIVGLEDRMTAQSVHLVAQQLLDLQLQSPTEPINLLIHSGGGTSKGGTFLHDLIANVLTTPVHALVLGRCASAATFVLLACKVRRSLPHSVFLIHSGTIGGFEIKMDEPSIKKVDRLASEMKKDREWAVRFYSRKLRVSPKKARDLIARGDQEFDAFLSAEEALELGLVTEIVSGNAGIFKQMTASTSR